MAIGPQLMLLSDTRTVQDCPGLKTARQPSKEDLALGSVCVSVNTSGLGFRVSPNFLRLSSEPSECDYCPGKQPQFLWLTNLGSKPQSPGMEGWVKHTKVTPLCGILRRFSLSDQSQNGSFHYSLGTVLGTLP